MKLIILAGVIITFASIGFQVKNKYVKQKEFLIFLESFLNYLYINISIYKNNLDEIINNYLIQQNIKNAKYIKFILKNDNLKRFDEKLLNDYIYNEELKNQINIYFNGLGKGTIQSECENSKYILACVKSNIEKTNEDIKQKGDLYFKIWLAIGVVVDIILWWLYEYFSFI